MTAAGLVAPTQALGLTVHGSGRFEAFLVPSAQDPSGRSLVVLPDRLLEGSSVTVFDPEGTIRARLAANSGGGEEPSGTEAGRANRSRKGRSGTPRHDGQEDNR